MRSSLVVSVSIHSENFSKRHTLHQFGNHQPIAYPDIRHMKIRHATEPILRNSGGLLELLNKGCDGYID